MKANLFLTFFTILFYTVAGLAQCINTTAVVTSNYNGQDVSCFGNSDGEATVIASGGTAPYTYLWGVTTNGQTSATATGLAAGKHYVTVTDFLSCSVVDSVILTEPTLVSVTTISTTNNTCNGSYDGSATVLASGGTGGYTYQWLDGQTGSTVGNLTASIAYDVTATDVNGCSDVAYITISQPSAITASISSTTNVSCFGGSDGAITTTTNGGTPGYNFVWSNGNTTHNPSGLSAGVYCVTVTDINVCTVTTCVTLTQPTALSVNTSNTVNVSCFGGNDGVATIVGIGGVAPYYYQWSANAGNQTGAVASGLSVGTYDVTATDANGCSASASVTITQPASAISATITIVNNVYCNGGSDGTATITPSGGNPGYTFQWSPSAYNQTTGTATGLAAGVHSATVTDASGCSASASVTITEPVAITASISSSTNLACFGDANGTATVVGNGGTGGYTFYWTSGSTTPTAIGLSAGIYTASITDFNGCEATATVTITNPSALSVTISSVTNVSCFGGSDGSINTSVNGGTPNYTYSWNNGNVIANITNLSAGVHCLTVMDANACTATACVTITEPTAITSTIISTTPVSCSGWVDGTATVNASGGAGPYIFYWPSGPTTATATGLASGLYTVTVIDNNGCTASANVTITQPPLLSLSLSTPDTICTNTSTSITATAIGGTGLYTYNWSPGGITSTTYNSITNPGLYCVTVTDANACTVSNCTSVISSNFDVNIVNSWQGENPKIFVGDAVSLITTCTHPSNSTYNWASSTGLSCTTCANPTTSPASTSTYVVYAWHNTLGCVATDTIVVEVFTPTTSHIYIDVAPDSTDVSNYPLPAFWTVGSALNTTTLLPSVLNYGAASVDTNNHQFTYVSNGTAPEVTDVIMLLVCNQVCDTTYFHVTTASCVWPGDTDDDGIANNMDLLPIGLHHSAIGNDRYNANINYTCQPSRDWGVGTTGNTSVDIKHIDCDGNGVINDLDTNAIVLNWAQTHVKSLNNAITGVQIYIDTATANPGDAISLPIVLGNTLTPTAGYGIAFTINYDVTGIDANSVSIDFSNSWLGTVGTNMIGLYKDFYTSGAIEVAMTRTDHNSTTGGGTIGLINMTIKDDVLPKSNFVRLDFEITNVRFIDNLGDTISTLPLPSQILVVDNLTNVNNIEHSKNSIAVFPNPTSTSVTIQSLNEVIEAIQLYDMTGKLVETKANTGNLQSNLNLEQLPSGIYILSVKTTTTIEQVRILKN